MLDDLLVLLSKAPNSQIDIFITRKLCLLIGKEAKEIEKELENILEECTNKSLASDFAMIALENALKLAIKVNAGDTGEVVNITV